MRSDTREIGRGLDVVLYDLGVTKAMGAAIYKWSSIILSLRVLCMWVLFPGIAILRNSTPSNAKTQILLALYGGFRKIAIPVRPTQVFLIIS